MKYTVFPDGRVSEPFRPVRAEDNKGLAVWFYASRGKFEFLVQDSDEKGWIKGIEFSVSTRTIRRALSLVDSVRNAGKAR